MSLLQNSTTGCLTSSGFYSVRQLSSLSNDELKNLLSDAPVVVLIGSGISTFDPPGLPTGMAVTRSIFEVMFGKAAFSPSMHTVLNKLFDNIPFEILMQTYPAVNQLTKVFKRQFNTTRYNPIHALLAKLFITRQIDSLLTTNYDCSLDQAIDDALSYMPDLKQTYSRVVTESNSIASIGKVRIYFKIHGSADDTRGETMVLRLHQESFLKPWKRKLLKTLLNGKNLLILGYSGRDFEICPEIEFTGVKRVLWNFYTEKDISPNARRVVGKASGEILIGDVNDLLSNSYEPVRATKASSGGSSDSGKLLKSKLTARDFALWQVRILNSMSMGALSLTVCDSWLREKEIPPKIRLSFIEERSRAFHYLGKYKTAAKGYEAAAHFASSSNMPENVVQGLLLHACDNWRCSGNFKRAWKTLESVRQEITKISRGKKLLCANADLKEILLLRRRYQFAQFFRRKDTMSQIRKRAESLIRSSANVFLDRGDWYLFQQIGLWSERLGISADVTKIRDLYGAPPSRDGYEQLGFPIAQMMAFRDAIDEGILPLDSNTLDNVVGWIETANTICLRPELWKFSFLLLKKFPTHRTREAWATFISNFLACEYTPLMRLALLLIRP